MKITYDSDSLYIALVDQMAEGRVAETREVVSDFLVDLDDSTQVLGIEILRAGSSVDLATLLGEGLPLTDTDSALQLATRGGTQSRLEPARRRRPA